MSPPEHLRNLAACILSGQVPHEHVPDLCRDHPGLAALLTPDAPPPPAGHPALAGVWVAGAMGLAALALLAVTAAALFQ